MALKSEIAFMSKVAKDIIGLKFRPRMTIKQAEGLFYEVMRKHGIKEGTKSDNGRTCCNFEWTMCKTLFLYEFRSYIELDRFFVYSCPKDLEVY